MSLLPFVSIRAQQHRKSLLALHLRRIRLAYRKLSEAATHRLVRGFVSWIDKNDPGNFERAVVKMRASSFLNVTSFHINFMHSLNHLY